MADSKFTAAVEKTLEHEGGYVCDPHDPGGETNFGISKRAYPHLDIRHLTKDQAIAIYHRDYWLPSGCDSIADPDVAGLVFDLAVNCGLGGCAKIRHAAELLSDEEASEVVARAVKEYKLLYRPTVTTPELTRLRAAAVSYYESIKSARFVRGWIRRALQG